MKTMAAVLLLLAVRADEWTDLIGESGLQKWKGGEWVVAGEASTRSRCWTASA